MRHKIKLLFGIMLEIQSMKDFIMEILVNILHAIFFLKFIRRPDKVHFGDNVNLIFVSSP